MEVLQYIFDGIDDHLDIANNNDLIQNGPSAERSLFVVVRTGSNVNTRQVVYQEGGSTRGLDMYIYNGNLYFGAGI